MPHITVQETPRIKLSLLRQQRLELRRDRGMLAAHLREPIGALRWGESERLIEEGTQLG
jgi:hypothetical protein